MKSLSAHEVYTFKAGRKIDEDDEPVPDVITEGAAALITGGSTSPLASFNAAFNGLRQRMSVPVVTGRPQKGDLATPKPQQPIPSATVATEPLTTTMVSQSTGIQSPADANGLASRQDEDVESEQQNDPEADDPEDDELTLDCAEDVALEMDLEDTLVEEDADEGEMEDGMDLAE